MIPEIKIFLIAMSPILELRGAIPIGLEIYNLPVWSTFWWAVLGNLVPPAILVWLLEPASKYLMRHSDFFNRVLCWLFERTKKQHQGKFKKWEKFALVVLVAVPLPFTGAWTGALCAFLFGIRFREALPLIATGVVIAGIIVTLVSLGIFQFL